MSSFVIARRNVPQALALVARLRLLIGVALTFLLLGSAVGYGLGEATHPRQSPPSVAAARYMEGLQRMDGAELWTTMSTELQSQKLRQGDSPATFAAFYQDLKNRGNRIDQIEYVGGYQTSEKGLFIYVTRHLDPGQKPIEIVWLLMTGPDGLIDYVL